MDEGGENSSSGQVYEVQVPTTPSNQFDKARFEETVTKRSFSCWENFGSNNNQPHDINGGIYNSLSMDNMEMWHNISCTDLLARADATVITKDGRPNPSTYLLDLNSPQRTVTEPQLSTCLFSQFTPVTPEQARGADHCQVASDIVCSNKANSNLDEQSHITVSTRVEANQDFEKALSEKTNLDNTPQPKQTRRKHRPKVVVEGKVKSAKKSTPPKPDGSSTIKRKYIRKNRVEKSTETPAMEETSGTIAPSEIQQTKKSCRRKINFDQEQNLHRKVEKTQVKITFSEPCSTNQIENQPIGPITPSKIELQHERVIKDTKHTYTTGKCHINFSQETHDKGPSLVLSTKGKKGRRFNRECSSKIDGIELFHEDGVGVQSELSTFSECQENSCGFLVEKNAIKAPEVSTTYWVNNDQQYFRCIQGFDHLGNFKKKRTKGVKRVCDSASFAPIFHMDMSPNKLIKRRSVVPSSLYRNDHCLTDDIGCHPRLTWKSINGIDALTYQFEQLDINDCLVEQDRYTLVPYQDKNALVVYQREGSLVPFEGLVKRRKTRPKVDLDDETSRVWRLLLEDINSRGIDGTDEEKEKWWEEERRVFSGRADSFIARMRLVQGDRRFSQWKGSVVDSVVGVFLTQNVSDHLSSSAFMSLAARYPLKSESISEALQEEKSSISLTEPSQVDQQETIQSSISFTSVELNDYSKCAVLELSENIVSSLNSSNTSPTCRKEPEDMSKATILDISSFSAEISEVGENNIKVVESYSKDSGNHETILDEIGEGSSIAKRGITGKGKEIKVEWDSLRIEAQVKQKRERTPNTMDSLDYDAVRCADVNEVADAIKERGMNNRLAERIKDFLDRLVRDHGSIDLEWLRDVSPDKAKEYLLSFRGLGLKSVECVRLLTLHHLAFPVDTNVGRIAVRLGWVPLQPLPESLQLHLLELYPVLESIQKYLWPRLCKLDQRTLYELHYQMITFGKVFCTKSKPNCNACPLRGECRHFASAFASARLALPPTEEKSIETRVDEILPTGLISLPPENEQLQVSEVRNCDPIIEEPTTPERQQEEEFDIEDFCEEIPMIKLNIQDFTHNLQNYMERNMELGECDVSRALVALTSEAASIPVPKLKNVSQLRTEHHVYELPDSHPLLDGLDKREADDPCAYLLAIWTPGETADSIQPTRQCCSQESGSLCNEETCFFCNSTREANPQTVRGTLLLPCRTAMRGSFPLNGTYFQVNEVFADHDSSLNPIDVPRSWLWNLPRRTVYFGTSIPTIFKGLTTQGIQYCFWRGFVCVRGFDREKRAPRPLMARLHFPASKLKRSKGKIDENKTSTTLV